MLCDLSAWAGLQPRVVTHPGHLIFLEEGCTLFCLRSLGSGGGGCALQAGRFMAKYGSKSLFPIKLQVPLLFTVFALVQNRCSWQSSALTHLHFTHVVWSAIFCRETSEHTLRPDSWDVSLF